MRERQAKRALDVKRAKQMHEAGYGIAEIASTLHIPESRVRLYIHVCRDTEKNKEK